MSNDIPWEERYLDVAYERGHVEFFERVFSAVNVKRLTIVSPWITSTDDDEIRISDIVDFIKKNSIETTIVMRDPIKEPSNCESDNMLKSRIAQWLTLYYNNGVHAKIYVCRCDPFGFALLSSANLTHHGKSSYEVGLVVNGFGAGKKVIEDLELIGTAYLPGKSETTLEWAPYMRR